MKLIKLTFIFVNSLNILINVVSNTNNNVQNFILNTAKVKLCQPPRPVAHQHLELCDTNDKGTNKNNTTTHEIYKQKKEYFF